MVKVSIIVPIYNTSKYLRKCLDSLLNQTLKDIEIILVNDGSTEAIDDIIYSYNDARIIYRKEINSGIGTARNTGIDLAIGEFIGFIDSDDYVELDFCEKLYDLAIKSKCDIVMCNYFEERPKSTKEIKLKSFSPCLLNENPNLINETNLAAWNKLFHRSLFIDPTHRFSENLKYEDVSFTCQMLLNAQRIGKLDEALNHYCIREDSQMTTHNQKCFDVFPVLEETIKLFQEVNFNEEVLATFIINSLTNAIARQRYIKNDRARKEFLDRAYNWLNSLNEDWHHSVAVKQKPLAKQLVIRNRALLNLYCHLYGLKQEIFSRF